MCWISRAVFHHHHRYLLLDLLFSILIFRLLFVVCIYLIYSIRIRTTQKMYNIYPYNLRLNEMIFHFFYLSFMLVQKSIYRSQWCSIISKCGLCWLWVHKVQKRNQKKRGFTSSNSPFCFIVVDFIHWKGLNIFCQFFFGKYVKFWKTFFSPFIVISYKIIQMLLGHCNGKVWIKIKVFLLHLMQICSWCKVIF